MVARGKFYLYDSIVPALEAGAYTLTSKVDLNPNASGAPDPGLPVEPLDTHINVTAPRYKLPPDQALMTFPPANSEGAYENRLPQIVLKKRTLPWDRKPAEVGEVFKGQTVETNTPWLALVVIAEGEGTLMHDVPVDECVSDGVTLHGAADSATASCLEVPESVVRKVFPTVEDLIMLTHVREVNIDDTEAAMGDDDGFLAVVIANRLPQYDTQNCKPKAYTACLINVEGQLGALPPRAQPQAGFSFDDIYVSDVQRALVDAVYTGAAVPLKSDLKPRQLDAKDATALTDAIRRGEIVYHNGRLTDRGGVRNGGLNVIGDIEAAALLEGDFAGMRRPGDAGDNALTHRVAGTFAGFDLPLETIYPEEFLRFPVLTSWRFTSTGTGSFEGLMRGLDVGLLGKISDGGYTRPLPDCTPEEGGTAAEAAPVTHLPLETAETGHVALPYLSRTGTRGDAWYRGPFSPHRLMRRLPEREEEDPVLAHVSDHLRMKTPDGREDVSLAVAFETGRLLALSHPSSLASMTRWRRRAFGNDLLKAKQFTVFGDDRLRATLGDADLTGQLTDAISNGSLPRLLEAVMLREIGARPTATICQTRPDVRPGTPIRALQGSAVQILSNGLDLSEDLLMRFQQEPDLPDVITDAQATPPPVEGTDPVEPDQSIADRLRDRLERGLADMAEFAVGREVLENNDPEEVENIKQYDAIEDFLQDRLERLEETKK